MTPSPSNSLPAQLEQIGLHAVAGEVDDFLARATKQRWSPRQILEHLAQTEAAERAHRSLERRLRLSEIKKFKSFFSDSVAAELRPEGRYSEIAQSLPKGYSSWPSFCQAQYLETKYLLPGYILSSQGDRVAMAHSVEGRFPFLDHRVVEFASRLPVKLKMKVLNEKYLLRCCAKDLVPASVLARRKQPYRAPEGASLLQPGAREYVEDLLSPRSIQRDGIFDAGSVGKLLDKFRRGSAIGIKDNMSLVGIVSTQLLMHQYIHHFDHKEVARAA